MKFYNREKEIEWLAQTREIAFSDHSQMTMVTGRRRIGKTILILKSCENSPTVFFSVERSNESELCTDLAQTVKESIGETIPSEITTFKSIFKQIMWLGQYKAFNLVFDEFQEFEYINPKIYSEIRSIWDQFKDKTHVNLIISGSVYSMMHKIFLEYDQPLYGRLDSHIKLQPFGTDTLKEILSDYNPNYKPDDLLALYAFTGGIPKYVASLMDSKCTTMSKMVDFILRPNSYFLDEGKTLLFLEFGKAYGGYFSVLSNIAKGENTAARIAANLDDTSVTGYLKRLEEDYQLISRRRPILAKEGSQTVRFEICDIFLRFWFRYIYKYRYLVEMQKHEELAAIIKNDYKTYSGLILERYFRMKLMEQGKFEKIGGYWETAKGGRELPDNEIDLVAIYSEQKKVFIAEVKRQQKKLDKATFERKIENIRAKLFSNYEIETTCLTLEDM